MCVCIQFFIFSILDVAVDFMALLQSQAPPAGGVSVEVDHVMNILVSACGVVVILRVGDVSSVFQTIMVILHKLTASVSFKNIHLI
jgi:hypothetical protein